MSYRPPYPSQTNAYPAQYTDGPEYDLYGTRAPHESYDRAGYEGAYRDEPGLPQQPQYEQQPSYGQPRPFAGVKEEPAYEVESYNVPVREHAAPRSMRAWRYDNRGHLWNAGSRPRCIGRFFCCTVLIIIFLIIGILLSLALWIQPPNIIIGDVQQPTNGSAIQLQDDGLILNLDLPIEVDNPNYFSAKLTTVTADIFYPINNTKIGNGIVKNLNLPSQHNTNFTFPFMINYTESIDPNKAIIGDLATKCLSNPQQQLTVSYSLKVGVRVFFITVSPTINNTLRFACPISASDIEGLLKQLGLGGLLGGGSK